MSLRRIKVAQIAPLYESVPPKLYGGTERVVHSLVKGLAKHGAEVTLFASADSKVEAELVPLCDRALRLDCGGKVADPFAYQLKALSTAARHAHAFDIIHNHYDYPLMLLQRIVSTPVVTTLHSRLDHPAELQMVLRCFPKAPLVSISQSQRTPIPELNWVANVHHGIDASSFRFHPRPGKYLAFLGRFSREKRPDWAIWIARSSGIPLKIAAKIDENDSGYFTSVIKPLIDGKFVEYVGEISEREKSDFLGNALGLVFPIDWPEPFGLVMIEAMACGTPVLTRPAGSVPEIMIDGVTGYVRTDLKELARVAPSLAYLDRAAIRQHVESRFSIERMTEEYLNVYAEVIRDHRIQRTAPEHIQQLRSRKIDQPSNARRMAEHRRNILHSVDSSVDGDSESIA